MKSCFYSADCHPSILNKFGETTSGGEKFRVTMDNVHNINIDHGKQLLDKYSEQDHFKTDLNFEC